MNATLASFTLALLLSFNTFAGKGSGARGGGHVVEVNGKLELVDLVTSATCEWKYGDEILAENSYLNQVLEKLSKIDWYLALEFKREIEYLSWCFTGKLYSVPADDDQSFVIQLAKGVQQAAFRYGPSAYLDSSIYRRLSARSRAFLILHEALHSYLLMSTEMRQFKLMTMVKTLQRVDNGQIRNRRSLYLNLRQSDIDFPLVAEELAPFRPTIEFLTANIERQKKTLLQSENIDTIATVRLNEFRSYLSEHDARNFEEPIKVLTQVTEDIFVNESIADMENLLKKEFQEFSPALIAYKVYDKLEPLKQDLLKSMTSADMVTKAFLNLVDSIDFEIVNNRLVSHASLNLLGNTKATDGHHVTAQRAKIKTEDLPYELSSLTAIIARLAKVGDFSEIKRLFSDNHEFINAMNLIKVKQKLAPIKTPIAREKTIAEEVIEDIKKGLWQVFLRDIKNKLKRNEFNKVQEVLKSIQA